MGSLSKELVEEVEFFYGLYHVVFADGVSEVVNEP